MAYKEMKMWKITGDMRGQTIRGNLEFINIVASDKDLNHAIDVFIEFQTPAKVDTIRLIEYLGKVVVED